MPKRRYSPQEMLAILVGFDTTSRESNLKLIDWVEAYLADYGVACRRSYDDAGGKANLLATIGPSVEGGIVLSGHTDVVPVDGQSWTSDPFRMVARNGRLYGRGTADMKAFSAVALALVPDFLERPLARPIHLALSYDEEVGCIGVHRLVADLSANLPRPGLVMVGEPTEMRVVNAHKGVSGFVTRIHGKSAHSSQPHRGGNAIVAAARLIAFLHEMAEEKKTGPQSSAGFEPPHTTFGIGVIQGGSALNIVAEHCQFQWEFRRVPADDPAEILGRFERYAREVVLPDLRRHAPDAEIVTETLAAVPPLAPEDDGLAETLLKRLTDANQAHVVSYGTEGGVFQQAGLSTVVCGPGSIDQAHQPDEFIEAKQLELCAEVMLRLADWARRAEAA
ncbi:acetylornithine deacetylase [Tistlia consotensis]|uniref:Acetylornithine deacetylase n=1 Tax=Tistlia consotensis USBA 355 TaxID=560819 RepID=A0A1Y6BJK7_9PROT|nr:acetylornithine deacetylase [Tistlia consotensis]SMF06969.1 acetylornithine deacetylase [Tistlia consotensis USBA 355]SNR36170.1 acetylornithine deacetylase [Tistlia consotensis]